MKPNRPASSRELILKHSKARVIEPSRKQFITGYQTHASGELVKTPEGLPIPIMSRQLTDADARQMLAKKFG